MLKVFVFSTLLMVEVFAAPSVDDNKIEPEDTFSRVAKYFGNCFESDDITSCFAVKGIVAMNRASRSNNIEVIPGVNFNRAPNAYSGRSATKPLTESDIVSKLPQESDERSGQLIDLATQSAVDFFSTHDLNVKVPAEATQEIARSFEEGRGKLKKIGGPLIMAIGAKLFTIVPLILGGLALLTFKAVAVAKIALVLALFLGASKLFGGNKGTVPAIGGYNANQWSGSNGWSSGSAAYPYSRNFNDGQDLAYGEEAPVQ